MELAPRVEEAQMAAENRDWLCGCSLQSFAACAASPALACCTQQLGRRPLVCRRRSSDQPGRDREHGQSQGELGRRRAAQRADAITVERGTQT